MSVVAIIINISKRNIKSVIDDAEKDESTFELRFIAIAELLLYGLVKDIHKCYCRSLHSKYKLLDTRH